MNSLLGTQSGVPHLIIPAWKFNDQDPFLLLDFFSQKVYEYKKTTTHLNLDSSNNGISASVDMIGQHLQLAGEHRDLPELLFLLLHDVRLVFSEPGGDFLYFLGT